MKESTFKHVIITTLPEAARRRLKKVLYKEA